MSVQASVMKRMIEEKCSYGYKDICRLEAEEVCKRKGIELTQDFLHGFLEAFKLESERRKYEENESN